MTENNSPEDNKWRTDVHKYWIKLTSDQNDSYLSTNSNINKLYHKKDWLLWLCFVVIILSFLFTLIPEIQVVINHRI